MTDYDYGNHKIREITPSGEVSTLKGLKDATGTDAVFESLTTIAIDVQGNLYVRDKERIRKITSGGIVSDFAGSTEGYVDGPGVDAKFFFPTGMDVDIQGNVYVADSANNRIRKITQE